MSHGGEDLVKTELMAMIAGATKNVQPSQVTVVSITPTEASHNLLHQECVVRFRVRAPENAGAAAIADMQANLSEPSLPLGLTGAARVVHLVQAEDEPAAAGTPSQAATDETRLAGIVHDVFSGSKLDVHLCNLDDSTRKGCTDNIDALRQEQAEERRECLGIRVARPPPVAPGNVNKLAFGEPLVAHPGIVSANYLSVAAQSNTTLQRFREAGTQAPMTPAQLAADHEIALRIQERQAAKTNLIHSPFMGTPPVDQLSQANAADLAGITSIPLRLLLEHALQCAPANVLDVPHVPSRAILEDVKKLILFVFGSYALNSDCSGTRGKLESMSMQAWEQFLNLESQDAGLGSMFRLQEMVIADIYLPQPVSIQLLQEGQDNKDRYQPSAAQAQEKAFPPAFHEVRLALLKAFTCQILETRRGLGATSDLGVVWGGDGAKGWGLNSGPGSATPWQEFESSLSKVVHPQNLHDQRKFRKLQPQRVQAMHEFGQKAAMVAARLAGGAAVQAEQPRLLAAHRMEIIAGEIAAALRRGEIDRETLRDAGAKGGAATGLSLISSRLSVYLSLSLSLSLSALPL